jgi:hypothetical protein
MSEKIWRRSENVWKVSEKLRVVAVSLDQMIIP